MPKSKYLILGLFIVSTFCACKEANQKQNNTQKIIQSDETVLNWMGHWLNREGKEDLVRKVAREYEFINKGLKVNLKFPQEILKTEDYRGRLTDTIVKMITTGHVTWDIIYMDQGMYSQVANKLKDPKWGSKYLVNFEELDWFAERHKQLVFDIPQYRNSMGGNITGPVLEGFYFGLWYNTIVAEKIGLDIKPLGMTFDDLKDYIHKAQRYNQQASEKIQIMTQDNGANTISSIFNSLVMSELGNFDTAHVDINKGKEALRKGLKAFEELAAYEPFNKSEVKLDPKEETILSGKCLFIGFQSYVYNRWGKIDKERTKNIVPVELPVFKNQGMFYQGTYQCVWGVLQNAPHKNEAINLLKYWCSNDIAEQWLQKTKNPTGIKTRLNTNNFGQDQLDRFNLGIESKYDKNVQTYQLAAMLFGSRNKGIQINPAPVIYGEKTADDYYNEIVKQVKR